MAAVHPQVVELCSAWRMASARSFPFLLLLLLLAPPSYKIMIIIIQAVHHLTNLGERGTERRRRR